MADLTCKVCTRTIEEDQDSTVLVCHAGGQTVSHTSHVHDKCWERFKKQFVRGRAGGRSATVFFCPVDGCHNALEHTHTHARKVEKRPERRLADNAGGEEEGSEAKKENSARHRREYEELEEEARRQHAAHACHLLLPYVPPCVRSCASAGAALLLSSAACAAVQAFATPACPRQDEDENRCREFKTDGTRCGRNIFDVELGVCKLHVETAKRKIKCVAAPSPGRRCCRSSPRARPGSARPAWPAGAHSVAHRTLAAAARLTQEIQDDNAKAARERKESGLNGDDDGLGALAAARRANASRGIKLDDIPDAPPPRPSSAADAAAGMSSSAELASVETIMAPVKVAAWALAKTGINQQKAREAPTGVDYESLDDCPICLDEKAIIQLQPCSHAFCPACIDTWIQQRSSFAQTLRTGCSITTCPLCRAGVQDTVALAAAPEPSEGAAAEATPDAADWHVLAKERERELIMKAKEVRAHMGITATSAAGASAAQAKTAWGAARVGAPSASTAPLGGGASDLKSGAPAWGGKAEVSRSGSRFFPESELPLGAEEREARRGERSSNTSDAGAASSISAMESRLAAMLEDDGDGGLLGTLALGTLSQHRHPPRHPSRHPFRHPSRRPFRRPFRRRRALRPCAACRPALCSPPGCVPTHRPTDRPTDRPPPAARYADDEEKTSATPTDGDPEIERQKEQEEARKHAEWMKKQMASCKEKAGSTSPTSSQAASDASTFGADVFGAVAEGAPGSVSPPNSTTGNAADEAPPAPVSPPGLSAFGKSEAARSKGGGWNAFGGAGPGAFGAFGELAATSGEGSSSLGSHPRPGAARVGANAFVEKEQLLRAEIGALREQLAAKESQCAALGASAARTQEAEARATSLVGELESTHRQLEAVQRDLLNSRAGDDGKATVSPQAWQALLDENGMLKAAERAATSATQRENEALRVELENANARVERMRQELDERDRQVHALQRQLHAAHAPGASIGHPSTVPLSISNSLATSSLHGAVNAAPFNPGASCYAPPAPSPGVYAAAAQSAIRQPPGASRSPALSQQPTRTSHPPLASAQQPAGQAGRPLSSAPSGPWRCDHCTFENRNPPIYDQLTSTHKGFCEICQGVTTVRPR